MLEELVLMIDGYRDETGMVPIIAMNPIRYEELYVDAIDRLLYGGCPADLLGVTLFLSDNIRLNNDDGEKILAVVCEEPIDWFSRHGLDERQKKDEARKKRLEFHAKMIELERRGDYGAVRALQREFRALLEEEEK